MIVPRPRRMIIAMIPIQDLLHRIQWDRAWRGCVFEIGYVDRVAGRVIQVPFGAVRLRGRAPASLTVTGNDGVVRRIPLHRVREVWRDGVVIWRRGPVTRGA